MASRMHLENIQKWPNAMVPDRQIHRTSVDQIGMDQTIIVAAVTMAVTMDACNTNNIDLIRDQVNQLMKSEEEMYEVNKKI